ncbi:MAG: hypothetical protein II840_04810, partial [Kiritimatiellae bacterium]|nr:hypothetical protein [Kiritimatiellia bacterium]
FHADIIPQMQGGCMARSGGAVARTPTVGVSNSDFQAALSTKNSEEPRFFTLEAPIVIGKEFKDMVSREFRRVVYTGTMGWRKQLVRPSHEVALGIWLARLNVSTGAGKS